VIEYHDRFAIPLRRPPVQKSERVGHDGGGIERFGRAIVQALDRLG
jgi:hypothetical protein